jgi:hypothetical protein
VVPTAGSYPPDTPLAAGTQNSNGEPAIGVSVTNTFGSLGSNYNTTTTHVCGSGSGNCSNFYAKQGVWNTDESRLLLQDGLSGSGTVVYNASTYAPIFNIDNAARWHPTEHRVWSNTDRKYIYGADRDAATWGRVDITALTDATATKSLANYNAQGFTTASFGLYEGNISDDDTRAALVGNRTTPFLINAQTGAYICKVTSGGYFDGNHAVDDTTISHDGQWMLVNWGSAYGIDAYNASDCSWVRKVSGLGSHYEACVSQDNAQVIVQLNADGSIMMTKIGTGAQSRVYDERSHYSHLSGHISCRNVLRPGWAYVTLNYDACTSEFTNIWGNQRIFAIKLDASPVGTGTIENFAWTHEKCDANLSPYGAAGSVSRNGDKVFFRTNWDGTTPSGAWHGYVAQRQ